MTSEVLLMNRECLVMAADSAATVSDGYISKVFTTDKIFKLSDSQPIGIMFYGNAAINSIPLSLIVNQYRSQTRDCSFGTLEEAAENFLDFLANGCTVEPRRYEPIIDRQSIDMTVIQMVYGLWKQLTNWVTIEISRGISSTLISKNGRISLTNNTKEIMTSILGQLRPTEEDIAESKADANEWGYDWKENYETNLRGIISAMEKNDVCPETPSMMSFCFDDFRDDVLEIIALRMTMPGSMDDVTGVVIAGYGGDEIYPSFKQYEIDGYYYAGLNAINMDVVSIDFDRRSWIETFAQRDVVETYLNGINPQIKEKILDDIKTMLDRNVRNICGKPRGEKDKERVNRLLTDNEKAIEDYSDVLEGYCEEYSEPMKDAIAFLSKDEMAKLAKSMVDFTSLKKRVSLDLETVGGPADVVVLSKHDGFVWIERKQYFNMELNPGYELNKHQRR